MVTLKDVAEQAGVSAQLVSMVINGKAEKYRIAPATSERIAEVARKMGYDAGNHRGARRMAARKHGLRIPSNVIAVCSITDLALSDPPVASAFRIDPYDAEILAGIDAAAYAYGLDVLSCRHCSDALPRLIRSGEVDGVIPMGCSVPILEQLVALKIPLAQIVVPYPSSHFVGIANAQGMHDVVFHLANLGHRTIAYLGFTVDERWDEPAEYIVSSERFAGYHQAMQRSGLRPRYVETSLRQQNFEIVGDAVESLWKKSRGKITAVVCHNDLLAMGAIRRLERLGLNVPDDISVTGFDDISRQFAFEPLITSVYYDRFKLGYRAVELLRQSRDGWLAGKEIKWAHEVLPVEFVERQSTAPPRTK